ncbi:MAG: hypothetical protein PVF17_08810 [Ignavibacteria bacterium]|jgi:hypothetical protein
MNKLLNFIYPTVILLCLIFIQPGCSSNENPADGGIGSTTVTGTLTLPAVANGKTFAVIIDNDSDGDNGFLYSVTGTCSSGTTLNYSINNVAEGNYYIYAVVFVVGDTTQGPQTGDYLGIYGGTISNPPTSRNASVPSSGTVTFNITLYVMS